MVDEERLPCDSAPTNEQITECSIYSPLLPDELRLVVLRKADGFDEPLEADLLTVKSSHSPSYEALSYVWGDPTLQKSILVSAEEGPPRLLTLALNLDSALRHLRCSDRDRVLWIDALCIDQHGMEEKEQQVGKMDQIYQGADSVCVWLGPASSNSDRGMDAVQHILDSVHTAPSVEIWRQPAIIWAMFGCLLQREWFRRRWVVQEIALAKKATVHCGYREVPWADLSDAISLYDTHFANDSIARALDADALGALSLSYLAENALRKDAQGNVLERCWTMGELLPRLPMFQVQNYHDVVYAILSLASDSLPLQSVDYSQPYEVLVSKVFKAVAAASQSLDIMFRPWALAEPGQKLPSFIAPASRYSALSDVKGSHQRIYHATPHLATSPTLTLPFDGPDRPDPRANPFEVKWPAELDRFGDTQTRTLVAKGVVCAFIDKVGDVSEKGTIPKRWFTSETPERLRDLWRVLVCGRSHDGMVAPNWYRRAFEHTFGSQKPEGYWLDMPGSKLDVRHMIETAPSTHIADFLRRVNTCVRERRYLASTCDRPGYFGLVPREAAPGDMICLLEGCSMPVVIRGKSMLEVAKQALRTALFLTPGQFVSPEIQTKIVFSLQSTVGEWLLDTQITHHIRGRLLGLGGPFAEAIRGINVGELTDDEYVHELRPHIERFYREQLAGRLIDMGNTTLGDISEHSIDTLFEEALKTLFEQLLANSVGGAESLVPPSVDAESNVGLGWADGRLGDEFQTWLLQAFEREVEDIWRNETKMSLKHTFAEDKDHVFSPEIYFRDLSLRDRAIVGVDKDAWGSVWDTVWAASKAKGTVANLCSRRMGNEVWERALMRALRIWAGKLIGTTRAHGGEVIGECYIQGLMDGEWWNSKDTKSEPYSIFIIG